MKISNNHQKGYVVSIVLFLVLTMMMSVAISMSALVSYRQKISTNSVKATQSYYASESGMEDALLRLSNTPSMSSLSYNVVINGASASVVIPGIVGGQRVITSQANANNIIKDLEVVYTIDSESVSFHYGAQIGAGGLDMGNGSVIEGNVFSNGNIIGSGTIDNNVIVASNGNRVEGPHVKGDVLAYSCKTSTVDGDLTYVTGGDHTCSVAGSTSSQSSEISPESFPITQSQIDDWKTDAVNGGVITGNYTIGNNQTISLGPKKITGNLTFGNNSTLNITGTLHVVGNIVFGNNDKIKLDTAYGSLSGVLLMDGSFDTGNSSTLVGSGQSGSYLLVLSTSSSGSAITVSNNAGGAIFYASNGTIIIKNNAVVKEVTGYGLKLENNVVVQYESGLQNMLFSDGPSSGWQVSSWQEK